MRIGGKGGREDRVSPGVWSKAQCDYLALWMSHPYDIPALAVLSGCFRREGGVPHWHVVPHMTSI